MPCKRCGGALSTIRYHNKRAYRHCFSCHSEFYLDKRRQNRMKVVVDNGAHIPIRAHRTDAGLDLMCKKGGIIWPKCARTFDTGFHVELPPGTWGKVEGKSGLNVKHNVVSCGGTIDEGYIGSIKVKLYNLGWLPYRFKDGDKIAQLVIQPYFAPELEVVAKLQDTSRGSNGFGSTGR